MTPTGTTKLFNPPAAEACRAVEASGGVTFPELDLARQCKAEGKSFSDALALIRKQDTEKFNVDMYDEALDYIYSGGPVPDWMPQDGQTTAGAAEKKITSSDGWRVLTYADLKNFKPDPKDNLIGNGWLRRGGGTILTGSTGSGKSVLASQLAVSLTTGVDFFGMQPERCQRVLYLAAENDIETSQRDFCSIVENLPHHPCPVLAYANLRLVPACGRSATEVIQWIDQQLKAQPADVVVFDPYQAFLDGNTDINSSSSFFSFIRPLEALSQRHGFAIVLIMHTPKPRERQGWSSRDGVYMAAGTSAVSNWARTSCELIEVENGQRFKLQFSKNAERTGLIEEDTGYTLRELYLEHSGNSKKPWWKLSGDQSKPSNSDIAPQVKQYFTFNPEATVRQAADALGCSVGSIHKWKPRLNEA